MIFSGVFSFGVLLYGTLLVAPMTPMTPIEGRNETLRLHKEKGAQQAR